MRTATGSRHDRTFERAIRMAQHIATLRHELHVVRSRLVTRLPDIADDELWAVLTDCVTRIDRALAEKDQP